MSRKTQIGWIAVGVLLCLFSIGLTLKLRDGNKVAAGEDDKESKAQLPDPTSPPPPVMIPMEKHGAPSDPEVAPLKRPSESAVAAPLLPPIVVDKTPPPPIDFKPPSVPPLPAPPIQFPEGKPAPNWTAPQPPPPVIP